MELETFGDVLLSMQKDKNRQFHLLLGNGFSMAYAPEIFSYNALYDFITKIQDKDLSIVLKVIETKNFELIMQQLDNFAALIDAFGGDPLLKQKVAAASNKLKKCLLDAVNALHPEHVFTVPENQSASCCEFISTFLNTGGKVFSTNYDLLLYWVLMRNGSVNHFDGFGRDLENADSFQYDEHQEWSELRWGKYREDQNIFYLHGALPFFDSGIDIVKEEYDNRSYLLEKISNRMEKGDYPIFVTAGDGKQKLNHIMHNHYLSHCYDNLCSISGSVVTFGFNFGQYDEHIIDAINRAAKFGRRKFPKLMSIYVGVYSEADRSHIEEIAHKFKCKVHVYDAKSAKIWGC